MKIVRMLLFIPVAIVCSFLIYVSWYYVSKWVIGYFIYGINGGIADVILRLISNIPAVIVGIIAGNNVANYKHSNIVLPCIFLFIGLSSILLGHINGSNTTITIISAIIIIITSVIYMFFTRQKHG